ncbi:calcium-binding protein [Nonomuraea fuscirosea]|uniref:calcium-binding protein n=1 Tax=Nonomuraea fuscirosea TaxID=1291556 RepID=UPI0034481C06
MRTTRGTERRSRATVLRRHGVRALTAGAALAAALMAVAGPAQATTNVSVSGGVLQIVSGAASDGISVAQAGNRLIVQNDGDVVIPAAPCQAVSKNQSVCPADGVTLITVNTGDGDDDVRNRTTLRSRVVLGAGSDTFVGGTAVDMVAGGDGDDRMAGLAGDDLLLGAAGLDSANGGDGADKCDAETVTLCE